MSSAQHLASKMTSGGLAPVLPEGAADLLSVKLLIWHFVGALGGGMEMGATALNSVKRLQRFNPVSAVPLNTTSCTHAFLCRPPAAVPLSWRQQAAFS